MSNTSSVLRSQ